VRVGNGVGPGHQHGRVHRRDRGGRVQVGTRVRQKAGPHRGHAPRPHRHLHLRHHPPALIAGEEVLPSVLHPLHGPAQLEGRPRDQDGLGGHSELAAEGPSHVRHHEADPFLRPPEDPAELLPRPVGALGGGPHGEHVRARVVGGYRTSGLHGHRGEPGDAELLPHHTLCPGELPVGVASLAFPPEEDVVRHGVVQPHLSRQGGFGVCHRGQELVVHLHQARRILRSRPGLRHHRGHRLPHVPHPVPGQDGVGDGLHVRPLDARESVGSQPALQVPGGEDPHHSGHGPRGLYPDFPDAGVGVRAPYHHQVQHPGQVQVVHVPRLTAEETPVFLAPEWFADPPAVVLALHALDLLAGAVAHSLQYRARSDFTRARYRRGPQTPFRAGPGT
jgi:hypothetical protein